MHCALTSNKKKKTVEHISCAMYSDKILYTFLFNALSNPTRQCYYPDFRNKETETSQVK